MSSFSNPTGSQQKPCFCCSPGRVIPERTAEPRGRHDPIGVSSTQFNHQIPFSSSSPSYSDESAITEMISNVHLDNQGGCDTNNDHVFSSPQSVEVDSLNGGFGNLKLNMRALQSRQLGITLHNGRKSNSISRTSIVQTNQADPNWFESQAESPLSSSLPVTSSGMDLDLALNELGMLSTVTNSRRQYLLETIASRRGRRLHKKSESSPNLASLSRMNGYRIIQLDGNYVTNVSCDKPPSPPLSSVPFTQSSPIVSDSSMFEYRDPQILEANAAAARRRSVPRMSRLRKDRYNRSRCPYKIPNRLCHSMQEVDFGPDYFKTCPRVFSPQASSPIVSSNNQKIPGTPTVKHQSKSNGTSPAKECQDQLITRSHSVEDLLSVQRRLELVFDELSSKETEAHLDQVATQFNGLHMS